MALAMMQPPVQQQQQRHYDDVMESPRSTSYNFAPPVNFFPTFSRTASAPFFTTDHFALVAHQQQQQARRPEVFHFIIPRRIVTPATPEVAGPAPPVKVQPPSPLINDAGTGLGILATLADAPSPSPSGPPVYDESMLSPSQIPDHIRFHRVRRKTVQSAIPWGHDQLAPSFGAPRTAPLPTLKEWPSETIDEPVHPPRPSLGAWKESIDAEASQKGSDGGDERLGSPVPKPLDTSSLWSTYESPPLASPSAFPVGPAVLGIADYSFPTVGSLPPASSSSSSHSFTVTSPGSSDSPGSETGSPFSNAFDSPRTVRPSRLGDSLEPPMPSSAALRMRRTSSDFSIVAARLGAALQQRRGSQTDKLESVKTFAAAGGRRRSGLAAEALGIEPESDDEGLEDEIRSPESPLMSPVTPVDLREEQETYFNTKPYPSPSVRHPALSRGDTRADFASQSRQARPMLSVFAPPPTSVPAPLPSPRRVTPPVTPSGTREPSPFPAPSITVFRPPGATALAATALAKPLAPGVIRRPALRHHNSSSSIRSVDSAGSDTPAAASSQTYPQPSQPRVLKVPASRSRPFVVRGGSVPVGFSASIRRASIETQRRKAAARAVTQPEVRREARKLSVELRRMSLTEPDPVVSAQMRRGSLVLDNISSTAAAARKGSTDQVGVKRGSIGSRRGSIDREAIRRASVEQRRASIDLRRGSIEAARKASLEARRGSIELRRDSLRRASIDLGRGSIEHDLRRTSIGRNAARRMSIERNTRGSVDGGRRASVDRGAVAYRPAAVERGTGARRRSSMEARRRAEATIAALAEAQARAEAEILALADSPTMVESPVAVAAPLSPVSPSGSTSSGAELSMRRLSGPVKHRRRTSQFLAAARERASSTMPMTTALRSSPPPPQPERFTIPPVPNPARLKLMPLPEATPPTRARSRQDSASALDLLIGEVERELGKGEARVKQRSRQVRLARFFSAMKVGQSTSSATEG